MENKILAWMESQKKFFLAYKRPGPQSWLFFSFFLKFLCSVGFWALSALSSLHFGGDRRPLRLVSCKVGKAPLLIFLPHAQQVLLGWASVSLLECLLVLGRQACLLFLEGERVELQPFSRRVSLLLWSPQQSAQAQGRCRISRLSKTLAVPGPLPFLRAVKRNQL